MTASEQAPLHVVTGAFGYSGRHIAARLLAAGARVRTLTNSANRPDPFGGRVEVHPFNFDRPAALADSLRGATVLYNTYWVRFSRKGFTFADAIRNTRTLFEAAGQAGVKRIVHVSITNASEGSDLEYFAGKGRVERMLKESGISHAILRPAVLFGGQDVLVNNIAWLLRRVEIFGVFGDGRYRLQPIHVDDLAALAVEQGRQTSDVVIDAIGPETFAFRDLVGQIGTIIGKPRPIVSVLPGLGYLAAWFVGKLMGDVFLARDEIEGLMAELLFTNSRPAGKTKLTAWAKQNAATLGRRYASELARRPKPGGPTAKRG